MIYPSNLLALQRSITTKWRILRRSLPSSKRRLTRHVRGSHNTFRPSKPLRRNSSGGSPRIRWCPSQQRQTKAYRAASMKHGAAYRAHMDERTNAVQRHQQQRHAFLLSRSKSSVCNFLGDSLRTSRECAVIPICQRVSSTSGRRVSPCSVHACHQMPQTPLPLRPRSPRGNYPSCRRVTTTSRAPCRTASTWHGHSPISFLKMRSCSAVRARAI